MKISIPLTDIMISPGRRFNPAEHTGQEAVNRIRKIYGVILEVMDITVENGMVHLEFRDATPEKHREAMQKLREGIREARNWQFKKALNLFKEVLAVIPENLDARRNMAKSYMELGNSEQAKKAYQEVLQLNPADHDAAIALGNIYARNENNAEVAAFYYDLCLQHHPQDAVLTCNYAALMFQTGKFQKAEVLFKQAIDGANLPNAYYGLALLYKMANKPDAAKSVLETMFARIPHQTLTKEYAAIYAEAQNLYNDVNRGMKQ